MLASRRFLRVARWVTMGFVLLCVCLTFLALRSTLTHAAQTVPYKINFQGRLTDQNGNIKPDGLYNMKLRLFSATSGGTATWSETRDATRRVQLTNGLFSIQLGDVTPLSPTMFTTHPLYVEVELASPATATCATSGCASYTEGPMTPRSPLGSSPYAFNADTIDGIDSAQVARTDSENTFAGDITVAQSSSLLFNQTSRGTYLQNAGTGAYLINDSGGLRIGVTPAGSAGQSTASTSGDVMTYKAIGNNISMAVDNGVTYGDNLLSNPGFEAGTAGWTYAHVVTGASARSGNGNLQFEQVSSTSTSQVYSRPIAVQPGEQYYISGYVKASATTAGTGGFDAVFTDKDNAVLSSATAPLSNPGTEYAFRDLTITVPEGAAYVNVRAVVNGGGTSAGTWSFDDIYAKKVNQTAPVLLQNATNSTTAFQIQDTSGAGLFIADTANKRLSINGPALNYTKVASGGALSFASQTSYNTGFGPQSVDYADFNGDGRADILMGNVTSDTVSVLMGNGNGTLAPAASYATGAYPQGVAAADFNGDSKPDIVTASTSDSKASVLMNNGSGTFATKVDYTTGVDPDSVTTADVNGDSKVDIITSNTGSNNISVLINNGSGTFGAPVNYATGVRPLYVTAGDFNGDSKPDLAATDTNDNTVSIFMNNGNGTFAPRVAYSAGSSPDSVKTGDFNNDTKLDLAVANYNDSVSIFMNNGNGTFAPRSDYTAGINPQSVAIADFNGDSKADVVLANLGGATASVLLNNGDGTLGTPANFTVRNAPYAVAAVDLNGDSRPDIITPSIEDVAAVLMNTTPSTIASSAHASLSLNAATPTSAGLIIQGAPGQTADLLHLQDSNGNLIQSTSATGAALFKNTANSAAAFQIQNTSGTPLFVADTVNMSIKIGGGDSGPDNSPILLVLDSSTSASDPVGAVNGSSYYNQVTGKFRCYEGNAWKNCIPEGSDAPESTYRYFNEFMSVNTDTAMSSQVSGGGANTVTTEPGRPGVVTQSTGSTTSSGTAAMASTSFTNVMFGNNVSWSSAGSVRIPVLSNTTSSASFVYRFGFIDSVTAEPIDGCYFRYTDNSNGGRWQGVCRNNNSQSACDTGIAVVAGSWNTLRVNVVSASQANFVINGTQVCQVVTNIPASSARATGFGSVIRMASGTSAMAVHMDYLRADATISGSR